jgi:hypothetical protein
MTSVGIIYISLLGCSGTSFAFEQMGQNLEQMAQSFEKNTGALSSSRNPFAGLTVAGTEAAVTTTKKIGKWLRGKHKKNLLDSVASDAADYLASDGERESSLLSSMKYLVRSYAEENHMEELKQMDDKEIVMEILREIDDSIETQDSIE